MTDPAINYVALPAGRFRTLEWSGAAPPAVFLHGLSGLADVWKPCLDLLGAGRPYSIALDQRGHGHSPKPPTGYSIREFVDDAADLIRTLSAGPVHVVGHSMGARVAIVLAARYPALVRSAAIVDIGPERWKANAAGTVAAFDRMPSRFSDRADALAFHTRRRGPAPGSRFEPELSNEARQAQETFFARLRENGDGSFEWLADFSALKQAVTHQRGRGYWVEWSAIRVPALLIRGGDSTELRPAIAGRMRRTNPYIRFVEFEGVEHNIPLLAPARLADELMRFWGTVHADTA